MRSKRSSVLRSRSARRKRRKTISSTKCLLTPDRSTSSRCLISEASFRSTEPSSRAASSYTEQQSTVSKRPRSTRDATTRDPLLPSLQTLPTIPLEASQKRTGLATVNGKATVKPFCSQSTITRSSHRTTEIIQFGCKQIMDQHLEEGMLFT